MLLLVVLVVQQLPVVCVGLPKVAVPEVHCQQVAVVGPGAEPWVGSPVPVEAAQMLLPVAHITTEPGVVVLDPTGETYLLRQAPLTEFQLAAVGGVFLADQLQTPLR